MPSRFIAALVVALACASLGGTSALARRHAPTPSTGLPGEDMVGRRMNHPEYGMGTILAVEGGGDDRKVVVEFKNRQQRKFLLRYIAGYVA